FVSVLLSDRSLTLGQALPDLPLFDSRGAQHRLPERVGAKATVVYFFAAGCPLARLYTPRINGMEQELKSRGVAFIGVSSQPTDSLADVEAFVRTNRAAWPIWKDRDGRLATTLGVRRTPEVLVFDEKRTLRYRGRIDDQYQPGTARAAATTHELQDALNDL